MKKRPDHRNAFFRFEELEQRLALDGTSISASSALPWLDLDKLTYSFAADGTLIGQHPSQLFGKLAKTGSAQQWQAEFQKAFDIWLSDFGVSPKQIPDSGAAFGSFGKTQGDLRFGDIRIGAIPLANNVIAEAVPHSIVAQGSWAGDILLNANAEWSNLHQVYSVALHEIGHVLGLGHSNDPSSPMYFHGVSSASAPTANDLINLHKLYAGLQFESDNHESFHPADYEQHEETEFPFDPSNATVLNSADGINGRYLSHGTLSTSAPVVVYKLSAVGETEDAQFLNVIVSADEFGGLFPGIRIYDHSGDLVPYKVLHYATGVLAVQVSGVESNQDYFIAIQSASTAAMHQIGGFEFLAEYSRSKVNPTKVGRYALNNSTPIMEQRITVDTSRLVHLLVESNRSQSSNSNSTLWAVLVSRENEIIAQTMLNQGQTRSMPIIFLEPGEYRLIVQAGRIDGSPVSSQFATVYMDEISFDVGPGVIDPTSQPMLTCGSLGADPNVCVRFPPVRIDIPIYPDPTTIPSNPAYPKFNPFASPSGYFWPITSYRQNPSMPLDVSMDNRVSAIDALIVVNAMNSADPQWNYPYDCNGDGMLSPMDVLVIINAINQRNGAGEGEYVGGMIDESITSYPWNPNDELTGIQRIKRR